VGPGGLGGARRAASRPHGALSDETASRSRRDWLTSQAAGGDPTVLPVSSPPAPGEGPGPDAMMARARWHGPRALGPGPAAYHPLTRRPHPTWMPLLPPRPLGPWRAASGDAQVRSSLPAHWQRCVGTPRPRKWAGRQHTVEVLLALGPGSPRRWTGRVRPAASLAGPEGSDSAGTHRARPVAAPPGSVARVLAHPTPGPSPIPGHWHRWPAGCESSHGHGGMCHSAAASLSRPGRAVAAIRGAARRSWS
jgi:hypothetical protein